MKPVDIKIQKIIMYIPGINIFCLSIWFYNSFFFNKIKNTRIQSLIIVITSSVPLVILQMIVEFYLVDVGYYLGFLNSYLIPLLMGYRFVKLQEELLELE